MREQFGPIDIYLFDQLLRGRIEPGMRILDAGQAEAAPRPSAPRRIPVLAVDPDPQAIDAVCSLAARLAPALPPANFRAAPLEHLPFPDAFADVVISSAVLHFAIDDREFANMLEGTWRAPQASGGLLFCRLASSIGIENQIVSRMHQRDAGSCCPTIPNATWSMSAY